MLVSLEDFVSWNMTAREADNQSSLRYVVFLFLLFNSQNALITGEGEKINCL